MKDLPVLIKRWLEREAKRDLPEWYRISITAYSPFGPKTFIRKMEQDRRRRERRLWRIANRMRKAGMDNRDVQVVIKGGWDT